MATNSQVTTCRKCSKNLAEREKLIIDAWTVVRDEDPVVNNNILPITDPRAWYIEVTTDVDSDEEVTHIKSEVNNRWYVPRDEVKDCGSR